MIAIKIPEDMANYLEGLTYEFNARKDLCAFMIDHGMGETESFHKYHQEYMEFYAKYEMAKNEMTKIYVIPKYPNCKWRLNFIDSEVIIEDAK